MITAVLFDSIRTPNRKPMRRKSMLYAIVICLICLGYPLSDALVKGQEERTTTWSAPVRIYEAEEPNIYEPVVVVDRAGVAHVLWRVDQDLLYYTRLDQTGWSKPVDVLVNANVASMVADGRGILHVVWGGGNNNLEYATAWAAEAHSAQAWSSPVVLETAFMRPHIVSGNGDALHIAFVSPGAQAVKYMFSLDGGISWSLPSVVAQPSQPGAGVGDPRLAVGSGNVIHIVWTEYRLPDGWPPLGVFYSHSTDGGLTWISPMIMASEGYDQITVAVVDDPEVHVAWNGMAGVGGRYHRWSNNGGNSWSGINTVSERGGTEGFPNLVVDSAGAVHLLTTFDHCAQYSRWDGGSWTQPACISGLEAMASNYIEEAAMALGEGNRLHAVFWDGRQRLWYTTRQVEAPAVPTQSWWQTRPTLTVLTTPLPSAEPTPVQVATATVLPDAAPQSIQSNSLLPVLTGFVSAALLVLGVVVVRGIRRGRQRS